MAMIIITGLITKTKLAKIDIRNKIIQKSHRAKYISTIP